MSLSPRPFLVADSPTDFAASVGKLLTVPQLRADLSTAAVASAKLFRPAKAFAKFSDALRWPNSASP